MRALLFILEECLPTLTATPITRPWKFASIGNTYGEGHICLCVILTSATEKLVVHVSTPTHWTVPVTWPRDVNCGLAKDYSHQIFWCHAVTYVTTAQLPCRHRKG